MVKNFENASHRLEIEELPGCRVVANITVSPDAACHAHKKAIKFFKKDMSLPGFRKGKVPDETVLEAHGQRLESKRAQILVDEAYKALLELSGLFPLSQKYVENVDLLDFDLITGARVKIEYESCPQVPNINWENISLLDHENKTVVSEEDLEKGLHEIRFFLGNRKSTEAPAQEGDYISLSLFIGNEDEKDKALVFDNKLFKLSEDDMTTVFKDRFLGLKKSDTFSDKITYPDLLENLRGDTLVFLVNDVLSIEIPELDDEMARSLKANSLEDLKTKLKIQLENRLFHENYMRRFKLAEAALTQSVDFDLPQRLFEEKCVDFRREHLIHLRLVESQSDEEIASKDEEIRALAKQKAEGFIKLMFLTKKIFQQERLSYSKDELQAAIESCSRERFHGGIPPKDISNREIQEIVDLARERLVYRKAVELVLEKFGNSRGLSDA